MIDGVFFCLFMNEWFIFVIIKVLVCYMSLCIVLIIVWKFVEEFGRLILIYEWFVRNCSFLFFGLIWSCYFVIFVYFYGDK